MVTSEANFDAIQGWGFVKCVGVCHVDSLIQHNLPGIHDTPPPHQTQVRCPRQCKRIPVLVIFLPTFRVSGWPLSVTASMRKLSKLCYVPQRKTAKKKVRRGKNHSFDIAPNYCGETYWGQIYGRESIKDLRLRTNKHQTQSTFINTEKNITAVTSSYDICNYWYNI